MQAGKSARVTFVEYPWPVKERRLHIGVADGTAEALVERYRAIGWPS